MSKNDDEIKQLLERMGFLYMLLQSYEQAHNNIYGLKAPEEEEKRKGITMSQLLAQHEKVQLQFIKLVEESYKTAEVISLSNLDQLLRK